MDENELKLRGIKESLLRDIGTRKLLELNKMYTEDRSEDILKAE